MRLRFERIVLDLLEGAIDMHVHSAPDLYRRILDDIQVARHAKEMGMRAVLIKNHFTETASRARVASAQADFEVFGGIALNLSVGGLNPHAVEVALNLGAKVVWLPTLHAREFMVGKGRVAGLADEARDGIGGIRVLNHDGSIKDDLYPILDLIARWGACLATGHITIEEARVVVAEAVHRGVKKIVVTHPLNGLVNYTIEEMKELLDLGATHLEHVFNDTTRHASHPISREVLCSTIRAIGAAQCVMSTDSGQWLNPVPVQQMGIYIQDMLDSGFSPTEVRTMVSDNPAELLDL